MGNISLIEDWRGEVEEKVRDECRSLCASRMRLWALPALSNKEFWIGPGKRWQQQKGRGPCSCCPQSIGQQTSGNLFHVAWQGNFEAWVHDPLHTRPIVYAIWYPHFYQLAVEDFTQVGTLGLVNIAYSGVYQWWGLVTPTTEMETECFVVQKCRISSQSSFIRTLQRKFLGLDRAFSPCRYSRIQRGWNIFAQNLDSSSHLFGTSQGAGTAILTLLEGLHPQTQSLWLTDMAHQHLAIALIFLIDRHMYRSNFRIGYSIKDLLNAHIPPGGRLGPQHMYSLPAYAFIAQDFTNQDALYTHHQYNAGFIMTGAFAHGAIFFIRYYNLEQDEDNVLARVLEHKEAIISHLSWASLFLGFHTLRLYVHNDVMLAFGTPENPILIESIFSQWIQSAHGLGDLLVHHAIALGLHTTTLILVKGALDVHGSKLMRNKKDFGFVRWPRMRRYL
nr:photosystem I P700 chlorophyll a apoprotein A2, chloroplastic [Tanacetum cinerariifolium]